MNQSSLSIGNQTPISWDTDWDCSSSSESSFSCSFSSSTMDNSFVNKLNWYHRNFQKQTTYESFEMKYTKKFRIECTEITSNLRDYRRQLLESLLDDNIDDDDESFELLCKYLNLLYGFIWCFDDPKSKISYESTSKLSDEFKFYWSDSIQQPPKFRTEKDTMFELISIIYHFALNLMMKTATTTSSTTSSTLKNYKKFMNQFDHQDQKRLHLASILFRIIGDQFLHLSSPLTIVTKCQTDLDSNILRVYQYQCLAEEREIELFKWIRSQIINRNGNGLAWKWPKIYELSQETELLFHQANLYLQMSYQKIPELLLIWRVYLQAKRNLYRTIRLIHFDLLNGMMNSKNQQRIHYWFDETKRLFDAYNQLSSGGGGGNCFNDYRHLDRMEIFDWIEQQILPEYRSSSSNYQPYQYDDEKRPIRIDLDIIQPQLEVDKISAKLFYRDRLWTRKVYDAFGQHSDDRGHRNRLKFIEHLLSSWKKPITSLRIRSQPISSNRQFAKSSSKKHKSELDEPSSPSSSSNSMTTTQMERNFYLLNFDHIDIWKQQQQQYIDNRFKPKISWPLENESYATAGRSTLTATTSATASNSNSSGYESALSGRSSTISSTTGNSDNDNPLRTLIDTRRQSLLSRKTNDNSQLIDISIVMNDSNSNVLNDDSNSNHFHSTNNNDFQLLPNRLFPISIDSFIIDRDNDNGFDDDNGNDQSIKNNNDHRIKPSIPLMKPKLKPKPRII